MSGKGKEVAVDQEKNPRGIPKAPFIVRRLLPRASNGTRWQFVLDAQNVYARQM